MLFRPDNEGARLIAAQKDPRETRAQSTATVVHIEVLCRARGFSRAPEHPNAIHDGEIPPCWSLACGAWFTDPAEDELHKTWLGKLIGDIGATGLTTGNLQPGYTGDWPDQDHVARIYGKNYERLRELKATWDPDNVFRANVNIRPAAKAQASTAP